MADIKNKNELKRRIERFMDELDYSINKDYCMETMRMMREFIGRASHLLDCANSKIKSQMAKLREYQKLEEQGLLLRLPCKVGDKAWYVHKGGIDEVEVDSFIVNVNLFVNVSLYIGCDRFGKTLTPYKTLFFTKEEAEQALKQMGE